MKKKKKIRQRQEEDKNENREKQVGVHYPKEGGRKRIRGKNSTLEKRTQIKKEGKIRK